MPRFLHHPERPPIVEKKELTKELKEYPELKAELTLSFPLNENRREALEMIHHKGKIDESKVTSLLESSDFIERRVGLYLLKDIPKLSEKNYKKIAPILEEMKVDEAWNVRVAVAQALPNLGEKALPILEEMKGDEDRFVREAVEMALGKIKGGYKWFLATQKPLFTTPYTKELAKRVLKLQEITKKLKKEFKDKFVGLTIFGSTAKGYFRPESDLDWGIITQSRECSSEFKKMAANLKLCTEHYAGINEKYQVEANEDVLFKGLFFGDKEKLLKIQKGLLKTIDEKKWDEIRGIIMEDELHLSEAEKRFGLNEDEIEKIREANLLLRVPPSLKETLEIVEKRIKKAA